MIISITAASDKGKVRNQNEDMLSVGGILLRDSKINLSVDDGANDYFYLLVSDGIGGHENGDYASEFTLEEIRDAFTIGDIASDDLEGDLRKVVRYISEELNFRAAALSQQKPNGCTLTGLVWMRGQVLLLNAGDSRVYRFRNNILRQLTTDDTERGITGDQNAGKGLLNCVGGGCDGDLAIKNLTGGILEGDVVILCSDGLSDLVSDEEIESFLCDNEADACSLVNLANDRGGTDNISVITACFASSETKNQEIDDEDDYPDDDGRFDAGLNQRRRCCSQDCRLYVSRQCSESRPHRLPLRIGNRTAAIS